ncbi:MAG: hypothetical protein K2M14_03375 [Muribaculaceae bacterium]|nr:hypothetical protein [Bacteroidales bacterium]MDE6243032.1 hypothetical protein [Muribaculaceae bacterium]
MTQRLDYTDTLHARLTLHGRTVAEITRDRFPSVPSIIAALRAMVPHASGLARLAIRNMSRGWTLDRPLMLYVKPTQQPAATNLWAYQ